MQTIHAMRLMFALYSVPTAQVEPVVSEKLGIFYQTVSNVMKIEQLVLVTIRTIHACHAHLGSTSNLQLAFSCVKVVDRMAIQSIT